MTVVDDERRRTRKARYAITDAEFDEISVVDKGDNPPARIVLVKRTPDTTQEFRKKEVTMTKTSALSTIKSRAAQLEAQGLEPAAAFSKAMDENPNAMQACREQRDEPEVMESPYEKAARQQRELLAKLNASPARKRLLAEVEAIKKLRPGLTAEQAWAEVHRENPGLYAEAKAEANAHPLKG